MGGDHPCPVCKATFTRPQHVARHMRSHTGDRPYKCQQCGDQFARSDLLSRHVNKCHSNNPQPTGRGKGAAANQELDDKRRACDQCNHSKVRCDFGIPCGKCLQRKTICTYAKPLKKAIGKKDYSDTSSNSTTSSVYDHPASHMPGLAVPGSVPLHYINPAGAMPNDYGMQPAGVPLFSGIGNDFMQMQAPRNITLESAGSSPETQNLSSSPNGTAKGRPRSLTVPTQAYQYPQQMYSGAQYPAADNGINTNVGRPASGPMSAYPSVGGGLTTNNVSALSQSMGIHANWPMLQGDNNSYMPAMSTDAAGQHTRNPSVASSLDASSLSNWNGSTGSAPANNGMMYSMANAPAINTNVNNNMFPAMDMSNFMNDEYGRPATGASDGSFANALDSLTLQDSDIYGDTNALYQQYLTNSMPAPLQTMPNLAENLPTGQTPDLWAAFMSEPFGDNTPTAEKQQHANGLGMPTPMKGFRPQLLTRLSKSNSMPDLTPLGKPSRTYQQQQQQEVKAQVNSQQSRTPGEVGKGTLPPAIADAESLKAYQQACLARQAPALKLSPKTRTGKRPIDGRDATSPHLASTLGIHTTSPARGRTTSVASQSSTQTIGRPQSTSQPPPQQSKIAYPYVQAQQSRPGSNLRPPGMPAFPTLSPQTRFLSQSLLAQNMPKQGGRPTNKRLPSTTLGPDNAKRALFHNLGQEGGDEHEYALFDDDGADFFQVERADENLVRRRRQSAPSVSPPTVRSSSASSASEAPDQSPAPTVRQRVISESAPFQPRLSMPQRVTHVQ
ncbi:hypothetical protein CALCODRAFT_271990 [Calocera cornea HHB12733]|uniref:Zn(2)-C6 fungal-type domain-containing protein n=1 Tax=Calocera cornea HHB12733 TaxID=1353952 RepID=A0A165G5S2_9BASI|nr:hypothetical protein CALCODRAFT_271990 [Calocera cornea HHB12733]